MNLALTDSSAGGPLLTDEVDLTHRTPGRPAGTIAMGSAYGLGPHGVTAGAATGAPAGLAGQLPGTWLRPLPVS